MAIMVAGIIRFCLVNSCKISHLGMKPVRGGSPPKERSVIRVIIVSMGDLVVEIVMELIFVELNVLNRRKVVRVMIIYNIRLS